MPVLVRNTDYPQGVSRAHDVALFCKWLNDCLNDLQANVAMEPSHRVYRTPLILFYVFDVRVSWFFPVSLSHGQPKVAVVPKDGDHRNIIRVLSFTLEAFNGFFKLLYRSGIWITSEAAKVAVVQGYKAVVIRPNKYFFM